MSTNAFLRHATFLTLTSALAISPMSSGYAQNLTLDLANQGSNAPIVEGFTESGSSLTVRAAGPSLSEGIASLADGNGNINIADAVDAFDLLPDSNAQKTIVRLLGDKVSSDGTTSDANFLGVLRATISSNNIEEELSGRQFNASRLVDAVYTKGLSYQQMVELQALAASLADEDGNISLDDALPAVESFLLQNPSSIGSLPTTFAEIDSINDFGIRAIADENADLTVNSSADITGSGISIDSGNNVIINHSGSIKDGDEGVVIDTSGNVTITNSGEVSSTLRVLTATAGGNLNIENTGFLSTQVSELSGDQPAIDAKADIDVSLRNAGIIQLDQSESADVSVVELIAKGKISLENAGTITTKEGRGNGVKVLGQSTINIVNTGQISVADTAINSFSTGGGTIVNTGTIQAGNTAIFSTAGDATTVNNSGEIVGNSGVVSGVYGGSSTFFDEDTNEFRTIDASGGASNVINSGTIKIISPTEESSAQRYVEIDGHRLYLQKSNAITAFSINGGSEIATEYDQDGLLVETVTLWKPNADDDAYNSVFITNSGAIDGSEHSSSAGILALASDRAEINNTGDIIVAGGALYANGNGSVFITNFGDVRVNGPSGPDAINATSGHWMNGIQGGAVAIINSGNIDIKDAGDGRHAIRAWSNGGDVSIVNSGNVTTDTYRAQGILASSGNVGECVFNANRICVQTPIMIGGNVTIDTDGVIITASNEASGVQASTFGGDVSLNSAGTISTTGSESNAIHATSGEMGGGERQYVAGDGGQITLANTAIITTQGDNSRGINAWTNGGDIVLTNNGIVSTFGENARGVQAASGNSRVENSAEIHEGGTILLYNNADVLTAGRDSDAVEASSTSGKVSVYNTANVATSGPNANGVSALSGSNIDTNSQKLFQGANVLIENSGNVTTQERASIGLNGWSNGGTVTIANTGNIATSGSDASAIAGSSGTSRTDDGRTTMQGADIFIANSGSVSTSGTNANAIDVFSNGGRVTIDLQASSVITATGENAVGLSVASGNSSNEDSRVVQVGESITATLSGRINAEGSDGIGVELWSNGGTVTVTNNALIKATGSNAKGLVAYSGEIREGLNPHDGGSVNITNRADISATSDGSSAIAAASSSGVVTIDNSANVRGFNGIAIEGGASSFTQNSGTIQASGGKAFLADNGADALTNTGSIIGDVATGGGDDILNLSGEFSGNVDLGNDDDTVNIANISNVKNSLFSGGIGSDTARIGGDGILEGNRFSSFEHGTLTSGALKLAGNVEFAESFKLNSDVVAALNGVEITTLEMLISTGASVSGSGTINGGLVNDGNLLLSSQDILKINGDFSSRSGSTLAFTLDSSSNAQDPSLIVTGGKITLDSSKLLIVETNQTTVLDGQTEYRVATADGGVDDLATIGDADEVGLSSTSSSVSFLRSIRDNSLYIKVSSTIAEVFGTKESEAVNELVSGPGGMGEVGVALNGLNRGQLEKAVEELTTPNLAGGKAALGAGNAAKIVTNVIGSRVTTRVGGIGSSSVHGYQRRNFFSERPVTKVIETLSAFAGEGINAHKSLDSSGFTEGWVQVFWGRSAINGSEGTIFGTSLGFDHKIDNDVLIGASFSYSKSGSSATNSATNSATSGGTIYGAKMFDAEFLLSGSLSYFSATNSTKRMAMGTTYSGVYGTDTFLGNINLARTWELGGWNVTPNAGLKLANTSFDEYRETGGGGALSYSRGDIKSAELNLGASFATEVYSENGMKFSPELHFGTLYEMLDDNTVVSYRFSPTGSSLTQAISIPRLKFNFGGSINAQLSKSVSAEIGYEGTFADKYQEHMGKAKFKVKF